MGFKNHKRQSVRDMSRALCLSEAIRCPLCADRTRALPGEYLATFQSTCEIVIQLYRFDIPQELAQQFMQNLARLWFCKSCSHKSSAAPLVRSLATVYFIRWNHWSESRSTTITIDSPRDETPPPPSPHPRDQTPSCTICLDNIQPQQPPVTCPQCFTQSHLPCFTAWAVERSNFIDMHTFTDPSFDRHAPVPVTCPVCRARITMAPRSQAAIVCFIGEEESTEVGEGE